MAGSGINNCYLWDSPWSDEFHKQITGYSEVATFLFGKKLHPVTVSQYVSKGLLKAEKHIYRGRELSFISPEEYERFSNEYLEKKRAERKEFYNKELGIAWF